MRVVAEGRGGSLSHLSPAGGLNAEESPQPVPMRLLLRQLRVVSVYSFIQYVLIECQTLYSALGIKG